jgi:hypothetical protein
VPAVVRRRGVFDPTGGAGGGSEADRLTASIRQDLQRITPALDALQNVIATRKAEAARVGAVPGGKHLPAAVGVGGGGGGGGPSAPSGAVVDPVSTVQGLSHSDAVLAGLNGQLLGVVHNLKGVATARSETAARSVERRNLFGGGGAARDLGRPLGAQPAVRAPPLPFSGGGGGSGGGSGGSSRDTLLPVTSPGPDFSTVTQAQLSRDPELQYLNSRAQDVAGLESTIVELGALFSRLASVVVEQGAQVERIDSDLEAANRDLEAGQAQLAKNWASVSSNSSLAIRVMAILVSFAVFYGVVLV